MKQIYCSVLKRPKTLFETEEDAHRFIWDNVLEPEKTLITPYYCEVCNCWHITSTNTVKCRLVSRGEIRKITLPSKKVINKEEIFKKGVKEINIKISKIEGDLGKKRYKEFSKDILKFHLGKVNDVENELNELLTLEIINSIKGAKRCKDKCIFRIDILKEKIIGGFTLNICKRIESKIEEVKRLREYGAFEEADELINEAKMEILGLEMQVGDLEYTLDLRKEIRILEGR
jgi:hypothetical protein